MRVKNKEPLPLCAMETSDENMEGFDDNPNDNISANVKSTTKNNSKSVIDREHGSTKMNRAALTRIEENRGSSNDHKEYVNQGSSSDHGSVSSEYRRFSSMVDRGSPTMTLNRTSTPDLNRGSIPIHTENRRGFPIEFSRANNQEYPRIENHGYPSTTNHGSSVPIGGDRGFVESENQGFLTIGKEGSTSAIVNRGSIPSTSKGFTSSVNDECKLIDERRSTPNKDSESTLSEDYQNSELTEADEERSSTPDTRVQIHTVAKQLSILREMYALRDDDPIRKQFLKDLFNFMARRDTPIYRMPVFNNEIVDLYDLYNQVVKRGGLVNVINKKYWRHIMKELNLQNKSRRGGLILRDMYMKYLYDYECERLKFSNYLQLVAAIDNNRCKPTEVDENKDPIESIEEEPKKRKHLSGSGEPSVLVSQSPERLNEYAIPPPHMPLPPPPYYPNHPMPVPNPYLMANMVPNFEALVDEYRKIIEMNRYEAPMPLLPTINTPEIPMQHLPIPFDDPRTNQNIHNKSSRSNSLSSINSGTPSTSKDVELKRPSLKRRLDENSPPPAEQSLITSTPARVNIISRGKEKDSVFVCLELHGVTYKGVLYAQNNSTGTSTKSINNDNHTTPLKLMR